MPDAFVDQTLEAHFESLRAQGPAACEAGLLLGCTTPARLPSQPQQTSTDVVLAVAPTPTPPEAQTAPDPSRHILDPLWIAEHALQAHRALPAGLRVLGVYVYAPSSPTPAAAEVCTGVVRALVSRGFDASYSCGSVLVLQRRTVDGTLQCLEAPVVCDKDTDDIRVVSAKPSHFRYAPKLVSQVARVQCAVPISLTLGLRCTSAARGQGASKAARASELRSALKRELCLVAGAIGNDQSRAVLTCNGLAVSDAMTPLGGRVYHVDAAFPGDSAVWRASPAPGRAGSVTVDCVAQVRGSMVCMALVHEGDSFGAARALLMQDAAKSLRCRADLLDAELADDGDDDADDHDEAASAAVHLFADSRCIPLARRVAAPLNETFGGNVLCCTEHLGPEDPQSAAATIWHEILGVRVDVDQREGDGSERGNGALWELEEHAPGARLTPLSGISGHCNGKSPRSSSSLSGSSARASGKLPNAMNVVVVLSVLVLILAVLLAVR